MRVSLALLIALLPVLAGADLHAQTRASTQEREFARDIFRELIEIDTSLPDGDPRAAADALARRLLDAGFPPADVQVVGPGPRPGNLVVSYRGTDPSLAPLLLMAHIDVVPARADDWSYDPLRLTELDGFLYGRGAIDNKAGAAMLVANFIRYRRAGYRPARDLVIVLTADEETTSEGIRWLLEHHPRVRAAAFALNTDAGGGRLEDGRHAALTVQAAEKVYLSYQLEVRNPGGHSSVPDVDNAIYRLADALVRLRSYRFPVQLGEITRTFFQRTAGLGGTGAEDMRLAASEPSDADAIERLSADPANNAQLRTTCVATMLDAGHAENALPQTARAVVNCRILPGVEPDEVDRTLHRVVADPDVRIGRIGQPTASPPSPLTPSVLGVLERLTARHFPGSVVIPGMSTGATDGLYVRNAGIPVYGVSAIFAEAGEGRAHGRDERIRVESFYDALDFWYDMVREFASQGI